MQRYVRVEVGRLEKAERAASTFLRKLVEANEEITRLRAAAERLNWREHARQLALALGRHRTDMHRASNRPCATCRFSKATLDAYLADVEQERALAAAPVAADGAKCPHGHRGCCGHHDLEDMPVHSLIECPDR
jgi:hypothetical protein